MKKDKSCKMNSLECAKMLWEQKQEKLGKINNIIGLVVILGMFTFGILGKELFIILLANKGINKITSFMIG